jgi:hypothetical protein
LCRLERLRCKWLWRDRLGYDRLRYGGPRLDSRHYRFRDRDDGDNGGFRFSDDETLLEVFFLYA